MPTFNAVEFPLTTLSTHFLDRYFLQYDVCIFTNKFFLNCSNMKSTEHILQWHVQNTYILLRDLQYTVHS